MALNASWYETLDISKCDSSDNESVEDDGKYEDDDSAPASTPEPPKKARTVHELRSQLWSDYRETLLLEYLEAQVNYETLQCVSCHNTAVVICTTCDFQGFCASCDSAAHVNNTHRRFVTNDVSALLIQPGGLLLDGAANYLSVMPPKWFARCSKNGHQVSKVNHRPYLVTFMDMSGICNVVLPVFHCSRCNLTQPCNTELLQRSGYWFSSPKFQTWNLGRKLVVYDIAVFEFLTALRSTNTGLSAGNFIHAITAVMRTRCSVTFTELSKATFNQAFSEYCLMKLRASETSKEPFDRCEVCVEKCNGMSVDGLKALIRYDRSRDNDTGIVNYFSCTSKAEEMERLFEATRTKKNISQPPTRCYGTKLGVASSQRNNTKSAKLDETGLICAVCKHNVAHSYADMNKGEKYGRVCAVLSSALQKVGYAHMAYYDNMCVLKKTIATQAAHNPENKDLSLLASLPRKLVPTFHVSTHDIYCKISNSPQYCKDAGANTGEICEVNNAKATQLSRITKMANKANRQEQIEIMFYNMNTAQRWNLVAFICKQLRSYTREKSHLESLFDVHDRDSIDSFEKLES